jgi:hypothetical protein
MQGFYWLLRQANRALTFETQFPQLKSKHSLGSSISVVAQENRGFMLVLRVGGVPF